MEFFYSGKAEDFKNVFQLYPEAIKAKARQKNKEKGNNLLCLDKWMQNDLKSTVDSRSPPHLLHTELVKLVEWKLARGKFRPRLVDLARSNEVRKVKEATGKGIELGLEGKVEEAVKAIVVLKGIGPATASAILAVCCPNQCCFFADEVASTVLSSAALKYSASEYLELNSAVLKCAKRLNKEGKEDSVWTPHGVELALWTYCVLEKTDPQILPPITSSTSPPVKKRKK